MIILDTNVVSELMKQVPHEWVLAWINSFNALELFTTAITKAEILHGLAILPTGRKRDNLVAGAQVMFSRSLEDRILPFDESAAEHFAEIVATRRVQGRPIGIADEQIAAITGSFGDTKHARFRELRYQIDRSLANRMIMCLPA